MHTSSNLFAAAVIIALTLPMPATAQGYTWQSTAFNDATNKGRYTAHLTYGVPETDDRIATSVCSPGSSARFATTILGYDVSGGRTGRRLRLEIFASGRRVYQTTAEAYRNRNEEGLSGILLRLDVETNRFWSVLSKHAQVRYRAGNGPLVALNLQGSSRAIARFLGACRGIFGMTATDDRDNEERNVDAAPSCRKFGKVRSRNSRTPITVSFFNHTRAHHAVMWLNYQGRPVAYKTLKPGESYRQQTFVGHPWMVTDGPGNCIELFVPRRNTKRFDITFE